MPQSTLLEINTRVWLAEQPWATGRADLALLPDAQIDAWAELGIDWIWLMGVWDPSPKSREICLRHEGLLNEFRAALPGMTLADVVGSPYAIRNYTLNPLLGLSDDPAKVTSQGSLSHLRRRLNARGIRLMLDFVPNHTALDHPWTLDHPDYYVQGTEADIKRQPDYFFRTANGAVLAHGKDPNFGPWTDTAQLNYFCTGGIEALGALVLDLAHQCDGLRCDMAMLMMNDVFQRIWGERVSATGCSRPPHEFWSATIDRVRRVWPQFVFMAEVYWGLEPDLLRMGFDYVYDKRFYDHLVHGDTHGLRRHLRAPMELQNRSVRFIENHDEPRSEKTFGMRHRAAALITHTSPGLRFFHEGQWEGRKIKIPVQLARRGDEEPDSKLLGWYHRLLHELKNEPWREGEFHLLEVTNAWDDNPTCDAIIATLRLSRGVEQIGLVVANVSATQAQGYVEFPPDLFASATIRFQDQLTDTHYERTREELQSRGLYLDLKPGEGHLFRLYGRS